MEKIRWFFRGAIGICAEVLGYLVFVSLIFFGIRGLYVTWKMGDEFSNVGKLVDKGIDVTFKKGGK